MCLVLQVLCCVDKQGILSWPSPNPEKILFFSKSTSSQETDRQRQKETKRERDKDAEEVGLKDAIQVKKTCIFWSKWVCFGDTQVSRAFIWCLYSQDPLTLQSADVKFVGGSGSVRWHTGAIWWHMLAASCPLSSASGIGCAVGPLWPWSRHPHAPPLRPPDPRCTGAHSTSMSAGPPTLGPLPSTENSG